MASCGSYNMGVPPRFTQGRNVNVSPPEQRLGEPVNCPRIGTYLVGGFKVLKSLQAWKCL